MSQCTQYIATHNIIMHSATVRYLVHCYNANIARYVNLMTRNSFDVNQDKVISIKIITAIVNQLHN